MPTDRILGTTSVTPKQQQKLWDKQNILVAFQNKLQGMRTQSPQENMVWLKHFDIYAKMRGLYEPEVVAANVNNIITVTREENRDVWQQRLQEQQRQLGDGSLATDSGEQSGTGD